MKVVKKISLMQKTVDKLRCEGKSIGFVATMGALHKGHIELIRKAKKENDIVVVSIFVNPLQFGPKEDYKKYPRPITKDLKICRDEKVDFVFYPSAEEMYPYRENLTYVEVSKLQYILCGKYRPGHFRGVATVVVKLFNIIKPHKAYFGEKDYQQLKIIQQIVKDLNFDTEIVPVATLREESGLACSSRNSYLSSSEYKVANSLYKSLLYCKDLILKKKWNIKKCIKKSKEYLSTLLSEIKHKIQYFEIYDTNLNIVNDDISKISPKTELRIFVAVFIGSTRLIDNIGFKI